MKKLICILLLCVCLPLTAADRFSKALPADGIAYVYIDVDTYIKKVNEFNGLFDAFTEEEDLGEFIKPLLEKLEEKLQEVETEEDIDFSIKESLAYLKTEMALYVAGVEYMKPAGVPSGIFVMQTGDNSEDVEHIVTVLAQKLAEEEEEINAETIEIGEAEFMKLVFLPSKPEELNEDDFEGMDDEWKKQLIEETKKAFEEEKEMMEQNPAVFGVRDGFFVLSNSTELISRFYENLGDADAESLAGTPAFQKTMEAVEGNDSPMKIYFSVDGFTALLKKAPEDDPETMKERNDNITKVMKWGLSDISSVGIAALFEENTLAQKMFLSFPQEKYGIFRSFLSTEGMPNIPRFLDDETFTVAGFKFDIVEAYAAILKMALEMNPQFPAQFEMMKTSMKGQGIDFEKLITSIGGTISMFQIPNKNLKNEAGEKEDINEFIEKGKTEFTILALELANAEPLTTLLSTPPYSAMFPKTDFMGESIFTIGMGGAPGMNVTPGLAIYNNFLLFSDSVEELKNAIRRGESKEFNLAKTLTESFEKIESMKPDGGLAVFSLPGGRNNFVAKTYEKEFRIMAAELIENINEELEINLSVDNLPSYDKIKKYINMNQYGRGGMIEGGYLIYSRSENADKEKDAE